MTTTTPTPVTAAGDPPQEPKPPTPPSPPPSGPASPWPPSGPREVKIVRAEYRIDLLDGARRLAHAIRTTYGWHIPTGRNARGEITWRSADTRDEAIAVMREVAGVAA